MHVGGTISIGNTKSSGKRPVEPAPRIGWVAIAGRPVSIETVLASPETRARWLAPHRGRPDAVRCLCSSARVPLGVKFYEPYGTYALYPLRRDDPGRHAPGCPLGYPPGSRADGRLGLPGRPCVVECAGGYEFDPGWPLRHVAPRDRSGGRPAPSGPARSGVRATAAHAALVSLLELLWRLAGLHYWQPAFDGERDYAAVAARLGQAAERVRLRGHPLADWFYCPPPFRKDTEAELARRRETWLARLTPAADGSYGYGYAMGLWRSGARSPDGERVVLELRHTPVRVVLSAMDWERQTVRWGLRVGAARATDGGAAREAPIAPPSWPVVWLARVRLDGRILEAHDLAALSLTDTRSWLPCESMPERRLLQRLVEERRTFVKPLYAGGLAWRADEVVPDVVLLDRRDRPALEVLGRMDDPVYAARWWAKAAWYRAHRRPVWTWDPARDPEIPPLPPPDRR